EIGLAEGATRLKEKLGGTEGVLVRNLAERDPWLLFYDFLKEAEGTSLSLDIHEGQFFSRLKAAEAHTDFAILFAKLRHSALDSKTQEPLLAALSESFDRLNSEYDSTLIFEASGANRFAVSTENNLKADIERVFSLSTLGLVALFPLLFRSAARLLFLVLPLFIGLLFALWVSLRVGGKIHALPLAFGGAL